MGRKNKNRKVTKKSNGGIIKEDTPDNPISSMDSEANVTIEEKPLYVKESLLNELRRGSHEAFVSRVLEMAQRNLSKIVGESITSSLHPIGTFKNHAIVSDDSSNLYRLHFESVDNALKLNKVEPLSDIKKWTQEQLEAQLGNEMSESLVNTIANNNEECENNFKENFGRFVNFKSTGKIDDYCNFRDVANNQN